MRIFSQRVRSSMPNKQSAREWLTIAKHDLTAAGEIKDFTGVSAPYEKPLTPDLTLSVLS